VIDEGMTLPGINQLSMTIPIFIDFNGSFIFIFIFITNNGE